jgi:hypothetical protein
MSQSEELSVRHYRPQDRERIREICCQTGFLGKPVDPVFEDRELFADFLTGYYLEEAADLAVVLEKGGEVRGYILCGTDLAAQKKYERRHFPAWFGRALKGYLFSYGSSTRRYLRWLLVKGRTEMPLTPEGMAHFHINLLPDVRSMDGTRRLFDYFFSDLRKRGVHSIYGQIVTFEDRRGPAMFKRYGFELKDKVEVTKFRHLVDHSVYLFTVTKDLSHFTGMYDG